MWIYKNIWNKSLVAILILINTTTNRVHLQLGLKKI